MRIGVGLPTTVPGADRRLVLEWARRADEGPFSSVAVLDRVAYDSYDPFASLAAAAAVTNRVRLATMIAIGPLRTRGVLAKEAASLHALSGGRFTLGLAVGARQEDYAVAGSEFSGRGRRLDDQLSCLRSFRDDGQIGPFAQANEPFEILVGGLVGEAYARMARYADGYAHNGGPPRAFAAAAGRARAAWSDFGRPGQPALWGQGYFALGDEAHGAEYLHDYYEFTGPFAEKIAAGNLTSPGAVRDFVRGYEEEGCDELVLFPTVPRLEQLERLADVLA
jgi:alkanesulfonate monooxygenase SsuD/methylene tetrahydromethanopterin reductase-like flavin-dependent oxidoreductase (luciferase family)